MKRLAITVSARFVVDIDYDVDPHDMPYNMVHHLIDSTLGLVKDDRLHDETMFMPDPNADIVGSQRTIRDVYGTSIDWEIDEDDPWRHVRVVR
jgi:hypothetical protein